jgi:uncharacterized membrane protein YkgB
VRKSKRKNKYVVCIGEVTRREVGFISTNDFLAEMLGLVLTLVELAVWAGYRERWRCWGGCLIRWIMPICRDMDTV